MNEDLSAIQDSNTVTVEIVQESTTLEIVQESTTPDNVSCEDKLANTGEVNALFINELNESTDISHPGSRSSSVAMETLRAMTVIEERTEMTDNDLKSSLSKDLTSRNQTGGKKSQEERDDHEDDKVDVDEFDSEDETMDRVEVIQEGTLNSEVILLESGEKVNDGVENKEECFDEDEAEKIEELISEEIDYYNTVEKSDNQVQKEESLNEGIERSVSESLDPQQEEFKVLDRQSAPKVMLEYEPSTTEAEDSDTLDTESLQEDFVQMVKSNKKKRCSSPKETGGKKLNLSRNGSISSDKEVARTLADESPSTCASRQMVPSQDDFQRGSTEPTTTQDTMGEQTSLAEDDGDEVNEVCCENKSLVRITRNAVF